MIQRKIFMMGGHYQALLIVGRDIDKNEAWFHRTVDEALDYYLTGV